MSATYTTQNTDSEHMVQVFRPHTVSGLLRPQISENKSPHTHFGHLVYYSETGQKQMCYYDCLFGCTLHRGGNKVCTLGDLSYRLQGFILVKINK